ncbi:hypothetical protein JXA56_02895 [Candidatus Micrarchaeota archaeon]|nr:hypothetical protein [Candidatus Micrarchaeota archaeon]
MKQKLLMLLVIGIILMSFGCTKRTIGGNETLPQLNASEDVAGGPGNEKPANASAGISDQELAKFFNISTDRPIGDEGLDSESPSSE